MLITDTLHTVDVHYVSDLLSQNGEVNYYDILTNDSFYDSSLTDESIEEFLHKTYNKTQSLCYVYHRKSCVYDDNMNIDYFSEDISYEIYYVDSNVCVKIR